MSLHERLRVLCRTAIQDHDVVAACRERQAQVPAEAAGAAGDDGDRGGAHDRIRSTRTNEHAAAGTAAGLRISMRTRSHLRKPRQQQRRRLLGHRLDQLEGRRSASSVTGWRPRVVVDGVVDRVGRGRGGEVVVEVDVEEHGLWRRALVRVDADNAVHPKALQARGSDHDVGLPYVGLRAIQICSCAVASENGVPSKSPKHASIVEPGVGEQRRGPATGSSQLRVSRR